VKGRHLSGTNRIEIQGHDVGLETGGFENAMDSLSEAHLWSSLDRWKLE
jgi:hypothetical protein